MKKIFALIISFLIITSLCACDEENIEYRPIKSCVLTQNTSEKTSGDFVILFASYSSEESLETNYYLYIKGKEGFRLQKISSEYLEIVETDDIEPQIKGNFYYDGKVNTYTNYIAYVPIGTITQEYKAVISVQEKKE